MAGHNLKKRPWFFCKLFLYAAAMFGWSTGFYVTGRKGWPQYLFAFAITLLWTLLLFQCRIITAVYCVTVAYCLEHIAQRSHNLICRFLGISNGLEQKIILYLVIFLVLLAGYFWALKDRTYNEDDIQGEDRMLIIIAFFVISADIIISLEMGGIYLKTGNATLIIYTHMMSIMISILALIVSVSRLRESVTRREKKMIQQVLDMEQEKYQREKAVAEVINIKCHDLKYHLEGLKQRMNQEELREISRAVDVYESGFHTGSSTLDVVLASKSLLCQSKHIDFTCIADGKVLAFMAEQDVYALFGNLLDNSIEAVEKLADQEKRVIAMTVICRNSLVFIHVENYYEGKIIFENGIPETTKGDKRYHGYGTQSIRYLTEKYGGDIQMQTEKDIFMVDIMIPAEN